MAKYKISGVWKDQEGVITHYAFHETVKDGILRAKKTDKSTAVKLLSDPNNEAVTWVWDYNNSRWKNEENVEVVAGKYLRSDPDKKVTDNLAHLINYDWL